MIAKTEATATPKTTRSDLMYSIISEVIIAGPSNDYFRYDGIH